MSWHKFDELPHVLVLESLPKFTLLKASHHGLLVGWFTIPNNKKDALVNVKFDNLPVVENQKLKKGIKALGILFHLRPTAAF